LLLESSPTRDRVTSNVFVLRHEVDPGGRLELGLLAAPAGEATEGKIRSAMKAGVIAGLTEPARVAAAVEKGIISAAEAAQFQQFSALRHGCIMVDDFPHDIGRQQAAREPANVSSFGSASHKSAA
jgi:acyl-CoA dehydrogenase